MNNQTTNGKTNYRPSLRLFHASAKGTGSAFRLSLRTATSQYDGAVFLSIAPQITIGDPRGPHPIYPRFDFDTAITTIRLDSVEVAQLMQVLRGELETVNDGKGLYHKSAMYTTRLTFRHLVEPFPSYALELFKNPHDVKEESASLSFFFTPAESFLLCELLAGILPALVFGEPLASQLPDVSAPDSSADGE